MRNYWRCLLGPGLGSLCFIAGTRAKIEEVPTGVHDLVVTTPEQSEVHVDWVSFE